MKTTAFVISKPTYKVYFVMQFSQPFSSFGVWTGEQYDGPGKIVQAAGPRSRMQPRGHDRRLRELGRPSSTNRPITAKIGISYVDVAGAEKNLEPRPDKDFDAIRNDARTGLEPGTEHDRSIAADRTKQPTSVLHRSLSQHADAHRSSTMQMGAISDSMASIHTIPAGHHVYTNYLRLGYLS